MKNCFIRCCLVTAALAIVASPFEKAFANYGTCLEPSGIEIPKRLRTSDDVDRWQLILETYSLEVETYLKCLAVYADQNKSRMSNREMNALRQAYYGAEAQVKNTAEAWNKAFGEYQGEVAQTRR